MPSSRLAWEFPPIASSARCLLVWRVARGHPARRNAATGVGEPVEPVDGADLELDPTLLRERLRHPHQRLLARPEPGQQVRVAGRTCHLEAVAGREVEHHERGRAGRPEVTGTLEHAIADELRPCDDLPVRVQLEEAGGSAAMGDVGSTGRADAGQERSLGAGDEGCHPGIVHGDRNPGPGTNEEALLEGDRRREVLAAECERLLGHELQPAGAADDRPVDARPFRPLERDGQAAHAQLRFTVPGQDIGNARRQLEASRTGLHDERRRTGNCRQPEHGRPRPGGREREHQQVRLGRVGPRRTDPAGELVRDVAGVGLELHLELAGVVDEGVHGLLRGCRCSRPVRIICRDPARHIG